MHRRVFRIPPPLLLAVAVSACGPAAELPHAPAAARWNLPVIEVAAVAAPVALGVGSVVADSRIDVGSKIGGRIAELAVQEGDRVRRGQVLVRLDAAEVEGGIRQASAGLATAQAMSRDADADLDRYRALADRGSVSSQEFRKVQLRHEATREGLAQARAALDTAQAQRAQASLQSPIDAVVVARNKRAGDLALPGQSLLTLESGGELCFETQVPESRLAGLRPGQAVELTIDGQALPLTGTLSRVLPSSDSVARQHVVRIALPQSVGLAAGQFGRVSVARGEVATVMVPRQALVERGGLTGVFVVDVEGRARFRWLRLGREWADRVEVTSGVQPRERLLARVDPALRDGDGVVATPAVP